MSLGSRPLLFAFSLLFAGLFARLGFWQLSRLQERREGNRVASEARAGEVIELNQPAGAGPSRANRRVMVRGEYDRSQEVVLRGHLYREAPGVEIVTPLRIEGADSAVLVNRGFVPSPDATVAATDSLNEPGIVRVEGLALAVPASPDSGGRLNNNGHETWRRLDLPALRRRLPYPLLDVYVLQGPDSALPVYPRRMMPPPLDDGPHLSYAIQWFAFATIAVAGGSIFLLRKSR